METVLLFILGVVVFIVGLVVSVALHEAGHLTFAKLFKVRVTQYMIGFGKTLWSFRRGGTEYGVKAVLLGGYIAMSGMYPPAKDGEQARDATTGLNGALVQGVRHRPGEGGQFYLLTPWKRIIVMLAGPVMNLVLGFVIILIMVTAFGAPRSSVAALSACVPATASQECPSGQSATPARDAGLRAGDVIVSVGGVEAPTLEQVTTAFQKAPGSSVPVVVERDGRQQTLHVTPVEQTRDVVDAAGKPVKDADGEVKTTTVGVAGISLQQKLVPQPPTAAPALVWQQTAGSAQVIFNLPQRLVGVWNAAFGGGERSADGPVGVIGVGRAIGEVASLTGVPAADRVYSILGILASLNIGLFVLNLVPLLPLDGGHVAGALWEMLKRAFARVLRRPKPKPVDITKLMPLTLVVVALLGGMTLLLAYADIVHPINLFG